MKLMGIFRRWAMGLAMVGMLAPQMASAAGPSHNASPSEANAAHPAPAVVDVALGQGGTLQGQAVNAQGLPLAGSQVAVRQQGELITAAQTDGEGRFAVAGLRGGVYQIETEQGGGIYRLWAPHTAPPAAQPAALVVADQQELVRGNVCCDSRRRLLVVGAIAGAAGVIGGVIGYNIRSAPPVTP